MPRLRLTSSLLLLALLAAACVPATPAAPPSTPTSAAPLATTAAPPAASPTAGETPVAQDTPGGTWIAISPQAADPGEPVKITGYLPGGPDQAAAQQQENLLHANVCWQDCQNGLIYQGLPVEWSAVQPGNFSIDFTVPAVPWIGSDGAHELAMGDYPVGVQCLGPDIEGCATKPAQASAVLHVKKAAPTGCPNEGCASLRFHPTSGQAGDEIQVRGWAPLDEVIGELAFGYSLVIQSQNNQAQPVEIGQISQQLDGNITGSFIVPQSVPGLGTLEPGKYTLALQAVRFQGNNIILAPAAFEIALAQTWPSLHLSRPAWIAPSVSLTGSLLAVDPAQSGRFAYCDLGGIRVTEDGGKTWSLVPDTGAAAVAASAAYPMDQMQDNRPLCVSVVLDPSHPDSFYTVFRTASKEYGAPPIFFMGFYTSDRGKTWKLAPVPGGSSLERFGGFSTDLQRVQAAFYGEATQGSDQPVPVIVEETRDGGATWSAASLACPPAAAGSCVRWGAAPSQISGMGSPAPQAVVASQDGGKTWATGPAVELRMPGPNALAGYAGAPGSTVVLISGGSDFPVQISSDGGQSWRAVSVPALPGSSAEGTPFPELQILPDGSLMALPDGGSWQMLAAGAATWCEVKASGLPETAVTFQGIGDRLWWLPQNEASSGAVPAPASLPLANLKCGG